LKEGSKLTTDVSTLTAGPDILPFRIDIPQADIDDLHKRLRNTRWPDELPGAGWNYGIPLSYVRDLTEYWATAYNWRENEARLNEFPQFTTSIDGQNVHFLHVRTQEANALPLLITHGWPGSIVEFVKIIGPLVDPRAHGGDPADAFHVVAPSIPGYGFSGPTREAGWDVKRIATAFAKLMSRLGYQRYGAQGGDWGSAISRQLGLLDPDHVIGLHFNTLAAPPSGDPEEMKLLSEKEKTYLEAAQRFRQQGSAYFVIQTSRPQTLAYALTDSAVGLLAWIAEKFREWSDPAEGEDSIERDQLLTNVSIYWFTQTANSSARLYFEFMRSGSSWGRVEPSTVPTGVAVFPREIAPPIRRFAERSNNIVHWSEFDRGGHFAAMEQPELLVADIRTFFRRFR
jgi:pimeloyl-ACP methyl ester carboxylesterase